MPTRPDIRELATNVKEAFGDMDRDMLLEILTFVVKEYVVEGPPPMLVHQAETLADLKPSSFAALVTALQARFDFPELSMLVVDGDNVSARIDGVVRPLLAGRGGAAPAHAVQMIDTRPAAAPPPPGVSVVEANLAPRPAPASTPRPTPPPANQAPPPSRGLSIRGRPSGEGEAPAAAPAAAPPAAASAAERPAAPAEKPETPGGDDSAARFSLLELD